MTQGLVRKNNLSDLPSPEQARTNLGLATADYERIRGLYASAGVSNIDVQYIAGSTSNYQQQISSINSTISGIPSSIYVSKSGGTISGEWNNVGAMGAASVLISGSTISGSSDALFASDFAGGQFRITTATLVANSGLTVQRFVSSGNVVTATGVMIDTEIPIMINGAPFFIEAGSWPSLDLRFAETKSLNDVITGQSLVSFTRASTGTYTDSAGVLQTAATNAPRFDHNPTTGESLGLLVEEQRTNLLLRSEEFDNVSWNQAPSIGTVTPNAQIAPNGTLTADTFTTVSGTSASFQAVACLASTAYTWSFYVKLGTMAAADFRFAVRDDTNGAFIASDIAPSITPVTTEWRRVTYTFTTPVGCVLVRPYSYRFNPATYGTTVHLWGAQLEAGVFPTSYIPSTTTFTSRASTATYFNASGVLQTAAVNEARSNAYLPDSNGVFRPAGLLLEEQRTNSVVNSNSITAVVTGSPGTLPTGWFAQGNSNGWTREVVGSGSIGAINYVDIRFSGTPTGGQFSVNFQSPGVVAASNGQSWSASIYHQLVNGSISGITGFPAANLWNSTLSYIGGLNLSGSIVSTSTLQRFASSSAINSAATAFISWGITFNCTIGNTYDFTIRFAGPQLEQGSSPTSFIPTTTAATTRSADVSTSAATTRSADVPQITGSNFSSWYRQDAVSVFSQFTKSSATTGAPSSINDGTSSNRISGLIVPGSNFSAARNTAGAGTLFTPFTANLPLVGLNKTAQASTNLDHAVVLNGGAVATAATYGMPVVDRLDIGCQLNGSFMNGSLARLTIWPTRLSNSTLQALTQ